MDRFSWVHSLFFSNLRYIECDAVRLVLCVPELTFYINFTLLRIDDTLFRSVGVIIILED